MSLDVLNRFLSDERKLSDYLEGPGWDTRMRQPRNRHRRRVKGDVKPVPRQVSAKYTVEQAYAAGFRWASVAPKGHVVTVHRTEAEGHRYLREVLRNTGCVVRALNVG